jgi:hypothetical protein
VRGEHAVTNQQDCRFAQPQAAPQGRGTGMCRVKAVLQPTTLQVRRQLLLHVVRQVAPPWRAPRRAPGSGARRADAEASPPGGGARSAAHRTVAGHGRLACPQPRHAQGRIRASIRCQCSGYASTAGGRRHSPRGSVYNCDLH